MSTTMCVAGDLFFYLFSFFFFTIPNVLCLNINSVSVCGDSAWYKNAWGFVFVPNHALECSGIKSEGRQMCHKRGKVSKVTPPYLPACRGLVSSGFHIHLNGTCVRWICILAFIFKLNHSLSSAAEWIVIDLTCMLFSVECLQNE